jgi:hypothetical protein
MELRIGRQRQSFIPLQTFRAQWGLPDCFNVAYFEPKDWEVGSIEGSRAALASVKQRVLQTVPDRLPLADLLISVEQLAAVFERELEMANTQIRLRPVELEFAVSGFRDILQTAAYRLIQLFYAHRDSTTPAAVEFDFLAVYHDWLDDTVRISAVSYRFEQAQLQLEVRLVYNAYGRVGLEVEMAGQKHYVLDMALACPAASFMRDLCEGTTQALCRALLAFG